MFTAFVGSVVLKETPLQPIQLLWINLIMDSFASLALATEPPTMELLDRPPYSRDEYIVSRKMVKNLMGMAVYEIIIIYAIVFAGENFYPEPEVKFRHGRDLPYVFPGRLQDWDGSPLYSKYEKEYGVSRHMTNVFNVFTVMQIFNMFNARKINDELNVNMGARTLRCGQTQKGHGHQQVGRNLGDPSGGLVEHVASKYFPANDASNR
jgi:Ca2+ transporting ATPase